MDTKKGKGKGKKGATSTPTPQPSQDKQATSTTKESTPPKATEKLEHNASLPPATKEERYKKAFGMMDKDKSGEINKEEFKVFFDEHGLGKTWTHERLDDMFDEIDTDRGGTISVDNFIDALTKEHPNRDLVTFVNELLHERKVPEEYAGETEEERQERIAQIKQANRLKKEEEYKKIGPEIYAHDYLGIEPWPYKKYQKAFTLLDLNDNGHISEEELIFVLDQFHLGTGLTKQEVDTLFTDVDNDKDGHISFMDFLESLNTEHPNKPLLGIIAAVHTKSKEIKDFKFEHRQQIATQGLASLKNPQKSKPLKATPAKAKQDFDVSEIHLSDNDFKRYNQVFDAMDFDSNGCVSKEEFENVVKVYCDKQGVSAEEISTNFAKIDLDNSGAITLYEFLKAIEDNRCPFLADLANMIASDEVTSQKHIQLEQMKKFKAIFDSANPIPYARDVLRMPEFQRTKYQKAFSLIDLDNSGRITKQEFEVVLKQFNLIKTPTREAIDELYNSIDIDNSGGISLLEFWNALGGEKPNKKLAGMVDTIIRKEKDIMAYIKSQGIKRAAAPSAPTSTSTTPMKSKTMGEEKKVNNEVDELKKIIAEKDNQIAELNTLLKLRDEDNAGLLNTKQGLEQKIAEFEKELESLREDKKSGSEKSEIDEIKKMIENVVGHVMTSSDSKEEITDKSPKGLLDKIQSEFDKKLDIIKDLKHQMDEKVKDFETKQTEANSQRDELARELEEVKGKHEHDQLDIKGLNERLGKMVGHEEFDQVKKERDDKTHELDALKSELDHLKQGKNALETHEQQHKEREGELEKEKNEINVHLTEAKNELENLKVTNENHVKEIERLKGEMSNMTSHDETEKLKKEKGDLAAENEKLKKDIEAVKTEEKSLETEQGLSHHRIDELEKEKESLKVKVSDLENDLEKAKVESENHQEEAKRLDDKLKTMVPKENYEKLKKEHGDAQNDSENLRASETDLKNEKEKLEADNGHLQKRVDDLEKFNKENDAEIAKLKSELEDSKSDFEKSHKEVEELKKTMSTMTSHEETEKLKHEKDNLAHEIENLKKELQNLKTEEESVDVERNNFKARAEELEKKKDELNVKLTTLQGDFDSLKAKHTDAEEEIQKLKDTISTMTSNEEVEKIRKEKDDLVKANDSLRVELDKNKTEKASVEEEEHHLEEQVKKLEEEKRKEDLENNTLTKEVEHLTAKNEENEEEIKTLKEKVVTGEEEVNRIKKERDDKSKENDDLKTEIEHIKTEKATLEHDQSVLKQEVHDLKEEKEKLNVQINDLKTESEKQQTENEKAKKDIEELNTKLSTMVPKDQVDELKKEQAELKHESEDLHNLEVSLENEKKRLEGENAELNKKIEELEKKEKENSEEIVKLKTEIDGSNSKVEQNQQEIDKLNAQISTMTSQEDAEKLRKERDNLDQEAQTLVDKIAALNKEKDTKVQELAKEMDEIAGERDRLAQELEALKVKDNQDLAEIQNLKEKESHMVNKEEYEKVVQEKDRLTQELEALKAKDSQDLAEIQNLKEKESHMVNKEEYDKIVQERDNLNGQVEELTQEKGKLNERVEALQEQENKNQAEIQTLKDNAISHEEFEKLKQENEELTQEVKSLKAQIDDDKIVSINSLAENLMTQQRSNPPPQEAPKEEPLSADEIQIVRGEILGEISGEETFLKKILQSISGSDIYKNPMKEGTEDMLVSQVQSRVHSRRISLIKDPGLGGNMIDYESAQKLSKMLSKPDEPESAGQGFGLGQVPTLAELQQKFSEIKQLRQDILKRLEVEKAAKEYIKEQKLEKEQENYQLKEELAKYQGDNQRNIEQIIHDEGLESPTGGIKQEGQNESSPPYTKQEFRELLKDRDRALKQLHQVTEALNKKQLKTSLAGGEEYQISSELREILDNIEKNLEAVRNDNVRAKAQASEQPQDIDVMQIIDYNVEEINKLLQKLQRAKVMSPTSPKKKPLSLPSSIKKKNLISQSPIKPVYEVKAPSEKSEEHEEDVVEKKPEVVENFILDQEAIKFLIKHLEGYLQQLEKNKEPAAAEGEEENKETGVDISKDDQVRGFIAHIKQAGLQDFMSLVKDLRNLTVENANLKKQLQNVQRLEEEIDISQASPVGKRLQNMNEFESNVELEESFNNNGSVVISETEQTYPSELEITTPKVQQRAVTAIPKSNRPSEYKRQQTEKIEEEESLRDKLENITKANEKLCQELLEKGSEIEQLTEDLEALRSNKEAASRNNEELNQIQQAFDTLKKTNENLLEDNTRKSSEVEKLTQDLQKALEQKSEASNEEYKKLQDIFENLKKEHEALIEAGSRKNVEFEKIEKERHQLSKLNKIYEEDNGQLKSTNEDVLVKLKSLEDNCSKLVKESQETKKENANLQKQNEALLRKLQEGGDNLNEVAVNPGDNTAKKAFVPRILVEGSDQKRFLSPSRDVSGNAYSEISISKSSPNLSYHILHWLSDDIVFLKKLAAVCHKDFREEIKKELKKIALEVCELNNGVKEFYTKNQTKGEEDPHGYFNHVQDLVRQCYNTQKRLQPIEDKVLTHVEELRGIRKK